MLLNNLSRVAAVTLPTMDLDDMQRALVVASGTFTLPSGGRPEPVLHEQQPPPPLADDYSGDPASSSLRREGQTAFARPGTDIYLRGHVWAPRRQACAQTDLVIRVAGCEKQARVIGDRVWVRTLAEVRASSPVPFVRMPIVWERSFGGTPARLGRRSVAVADRNPVGRGLFEHGVDADGQPLPNFEDPRSLLSQLSDRPLPVGFGPIARHWCPRRDFAGTYDQAWLDRRAPLWPPISTHASFVPRLLGCRLRATSRAGRSSSCSAFIPREPCASLFRG